MPCADRLGRAEQNLSKDLCVHFEESYFIEVFVLKKLLKLLINYKKYI